MELWIMEHYYLFMVFRKPHTRPFWIRDQPLQTLMPLTAARMMADVSPSYHDGNSEAVEMDLAGGG
jgi:hypothetical protein